MNNHDLDDERIRTLVQSVGRGIPSDVEKRLLTLTDSIRSGPKDRLIRRPFALAFGAGAVVLLGAFLILILARPGGEIPPIPEIQTEFELADSDIKIIFVQRPDFPVLLISF